MFALVFAFRVEFFDLAFLLRTDIKIVVIAVRQRAA